MADREVITTKKLPKKPPVAPPVASFPGQRGGGAPPPPNPFQIFTPSPLTPSAHVGVPYTNTIVDQYGVPPYQWQLTQFTIAAPFIAVTNRLSTELDLTLSWSGSGAFQSMILQRSSVGFSGPWTTIATFFTASPPVYHDTGLATNTTYYYQTQATTSVGTSAFAQTSGLTRSSGTTINWNPGFGMLTFQVPVGNNPTYSGSNIQAEIAVAAGVAPIVAGCGYCFFSTWSMFEGGSSGTQGSYPDVANNGTSFFAQVMADCIAKSLRLSVQFNPGVFNSGNPLAVPGDGSVVPSYILTHSTYGNANVGSSGASPQAPFLYGWYTQQTGGYSSMWMDGNGGISNVGTAMLAAIANFASQWDGNAHLESFQFCAEDDMYPYNGTGLGNDNYFLSITAIMLQIKSYFQHTNVVLQIAGSQSTIGQSHIATLVQAGVLVGCSDTAGAPAWNDLVYSISFTSAPTTGNTSAVLTSSNPWPGGQYSTVLSNGQTVSMQELFSGSFTNVNFSPAVSSNCPNANATRNFAWDSLGPGMSAWANRVCGNSSWSPPSPALQTYSTAIMQAQGGDFWDNSSGGQVYPWYNGSLGGHANGFTVAQMAQACNDNVSGGVGYHASHLYVTYDPGANWAARVTDMTNNPLTNTAYPPVYG